MRRAALFGLVLVVAQSVNAAEPPVVPVYRPVEREVTLYDDFIGHLEAGNRVDVRARVDGAIESIHFKEGDLVKRGQVLFQLDARLYRAQADKAHAEVARAEAQFKLIDLDFQRARRLLDKQAVSRDEVDKLAAQREIGQATVALARAELEMAKLNLDLTRIVAPIDGSIGLTGVKAGDIVWALRQDRPLATIEAADNLQVHFRVNEKDLLRLRRALRNGAVVQVRCRGEDKPRETRIDFINNRVDVQTGTVTVRAALPNPTGELLPGQSAEVRLADGPPRKALLIGPQAIRKRGEQAYVLIVDGEKLVEKKVRLGPQVGPLQVIEDGLTALDQVVAQPAGLKAETAIQPRLLPEPPPASVTP